MAAYYYWPKKETQVVQNDGDKTQTEVPPVAPGPKPPNPKPPEPKLVEPPGLPIHSVKFDGDRKTIVLPGRVARTCAGGDGRYLFLGCPNEKKLCVYDASEATIVKEIPTAGKDTYFAAGATKLLLADNTTRKIERYDLIRMEKDQEGPYPFEGTIDEICMGSGSNGPALVGTSPAGVWPFEFLDIESLKKADIGWKAVPPNNLPRAVHFSASADGTRWAGMPAGANARGAVVVQRQGKQVSAEWIATEKSLGFTALSANGQTLLTRSGGFNVASPITRNPGPDSTGFIAPAVSGPLFVHVLRYKSKSGQTGMRVAATTAATLPSQKVPRTQIPQPYEPGDAMPPNQHIYLVPESRSLIICPSGAEGRLEIVKFDPLGGVSPGTLLITSTPPDLFTPGTTLAYKVRFMPTALSRGISMIGPKGSTVRSDIINWPTSPDMQPNTATFQLTVTAGGKSGSQVFTVHNSATPAPKTVAPKPIDPKLNPKSPNPKTPPLPSSPIAPGAKLVQESSGRLPISPPAMKEPHIVVDLPGPIRDACIGGGGRYIIFHCPAVRKLVVFDVNTLKIEHTFPVNADDILFAASMEKLFLIYPDLKVVIRVSLATFKPEADMTLEVTQRPTVAAMGSATSGPLILGGVPSQNDASKMALTFIDLTTMKEVAISKAEGKFSVTTSMLPTCEYPPMATRSAPGDRSLFPVDCRSRNCPATRSVDRTWAKRLATSPPDPMARRSSPKRACTPSRASQLAAGSPQCRQFKAIGS